MFTVAVHVVAVFTVTGLGEQETVASVLSPASVKSVVVAPETTP